MANNPQGRYDGQPFGDALAERALLVAERVVRSRCRGWNVAQHVRDDLRGEVVLRLLKRLQRAQEEPEIPPIQRFDDYIASVASRLVDDLARALFPEWTRIKNRVRYLVHHDDRFHVFVDDAGRTMCEAAAPSPARRRVRTSAAHALALSVVQTLDEAGRPLDLEDLVGALAKRHGVVTANFSGPVEIAGRCEDPGEAMESAEAVRRLWIEIEALPPRQRMALLLNSRDESGESALRLLAATGLAPAGSLAAALGMSEEELNGLWDELPLGDDVIAARLRLTRQQVINLRKAARDRLARRTSRAR